MKTVILKVEVPDGYKITYVPIIDDDEKGDVVQASYTEIHLPTDEDINLLIDRMFIYREVNLPRPFSDGAKWYKQQIEQQ